MAAEPNQDHRQHASRDYTQGSIGVEGAGTMQHRNINNYHGHVLTQLVDHSKEKLEKLSENVNMPFAMPDLGEDQYMKSQLYEPLKPLMKEMVQNNRRASTYERILSRTSMLDKKPTAVQIMSYSQDDESIIYHKENFESIVQFNNVNNLEVIVLVVAGPYRSGKSFLLNWFIDRLSKMENGTPLDEISGIPENFSGFKFISGSVRETKGMLAYSKIFKVKLKETEKAFLLIDTQGTFDNESTEKENKILFSLSTVISSIQIYNVTRELSKDKFEHLELFSTYANFFLDNSDCKPFQSLMFLVRDWRHVDQYDYGLKGGIDYLNKDWLDKDVMNCHKDLLNNSFEEVQCFLMPNPGEELDEEGTLETVEKLFVEEMGIFIKTVIQQSNENEKKINGISIKCADIPKIFENFIEHFKTTDKPVEYTLVQAMSESFYSKLCDQYLNEFFNLTKSLDFDNPDKLVESFQNLKSSVVTRFLNLKTIDKSTKNKYKEKLEVNIEEAFLNIKAKNSLKEQINAIQKKKSNIEEIIIKNQKEHMEEREKFKEVYIQENQKQNRLTKKIKEEKELLEEKNQDAIRKVQKIKNLQEEKYKKDMAELEKKKDKASKEQIAILKKQHEQQQKNFASNIKQLEDYHAKQNQNLMVKLNAIKENREKQQKLHEAQMARMEQLHAEEQKRYKENRKKLVAQQQAARRGVRGVFSDIGCILDVAFDIFRR